MRRTVSSGAVSLAVILDMFQLRFSGESGSDIRDILRPWGADSLFSGSSSGELTGAATNPSMGLLQNVLMG